MPDYGEKKSIGHIICNPPCWKLKNKGNFITHIRKFFTLMSRSGKVINEGKGHKIEGNHNLDKYTSTNYICIVGKKRKCLK